MPVLVQLPANSSAETIQVSQKGKVITTTSVNAQLLPGIIDSIPQNAFKEPLLCLHFDQKNKIEKDFCENYVTIYQSGLNDGVTRIQAILNSRRPQDAIAPLLLLIDGIKLVTRDNYSVADSSELTQREVVQQIMQIVTSLQKKNECSHGNVHK